MRIIAKSRLREYWAHKKYHAAQQPLRAWHDEVKNAEWKNFSDLRRDFPKASVAGNDRVVFDIHGGAFRVIVKIEFRLKVVFIRYFGTHQEYDAVTASEV